MHGTETLRRISSPNIRATRSWRSPRERETGAPCTTTFGSRNPANHWSVRSYGGINKQNLDGESFTRASRRSPAACAKGARRSHAGEGAAVPIVSTQRQMAGLAADWLNSLNRLEWPPECRLVRVAGEPHVVFPLNCDSFALADCGRWARGVGS